jgi:hypothetical protein
MEKPNNELILLLSAREGLKARIEKILKEGGTPAAICELQSYYDAVSEAEKKFQNSKTNLNQLIDVIPRETKNDLYYNYKGVLRGFIYDMIKASLGISGGFSWGPS